MLRIFMIVMIALAGCKPDDGAVGPVGPKGDTGDAVPAQQALFRAGVSPEGSYSVTLDDVDRANPDTAYPDVGTMPLANAAGDHPRRLLLRFPVVGYIPSNASITGAVLQLTTVSTTSIDAGVTIGVYDLSQPVMTDGGTQCIWTIGATWNRFDGSVLWGNCGNPVTVFSKGVHYPENPMDSVVVPSAASGTDMLWAWNLDISAVQKWLDTPAKNNGVLVSSANEWSDTAVGTLVFGHNAHSTERFRPTLLVTYTIP